MLSDSATVVVRVRDAGVAAPPRNLYPWLACASDWDANWSQKDGTITIRRVDLTGEQPRLHQLGSVRVLELQDALTRHGFGMLRIGQPHFPGR